MMMIVMVSSYSACILWLYSISHIIVFRISLPHNILLDSAKEAQKKTPLFFRVNDDGDDYTE